MNPPSYDAVGYWSEVKLEIVREYATAYSAIMNKQGSIRRYLYIDAFSGPGAHISKRTNEFIAGSPLNAMLVKPEFPELHFIDLDGGKADELRRLSAGRKGVFVHNADCNDVLLKTVFPRCQWGDFRRALCLLDPYGLGVNWEVLRTAGQMKSVDIFYNFSIMDANMNVLWKNPDDVPLRQAARLTAVWGDDSWYESAYQKEPGLFGPIEDKMSNEDLAEAFRQRLKNVAGFEYVPQPMPMRNSKGAVVYYLFFASPNKTGAKIVKDIFRKYQGRGGS